MSEIKGIRGITRVLGRAGGRSRLAAVLAATALCGAVAVGAAPDAAARPDPGGVRSCPEGSQATSATETYAGTPVPGSAGGPAKPPAEAGRVQGGRNTSTVALNGELVGRACYKRAGGTATMQFRWSSSGRVLTGTFIYQLVDCTTGHTSKELTRRMDYETPTGSSGQAEATLKVNGSHKYRMRITGSGTYERASRAPGELSGLYGYWEGIAPTDTPKWRSETLCA
jgi:hypothetical protein